MAAEDVERWIRGLADEHPDAVADAAARLLERPELSRSRLVELVRAGAPGQQTQWAVRLLARLGDPADVPLLERLVEDGSSSLAWEAAQALGEHPSVEAQEALLRAAKHADPEVAGAAAVALGTRGDEAGRPTLERLLEHPSEAVRFRAVQALGRIGAEASRPKLDAARERESSPDVRRALDDALARPPTGEA